MKSKSPIHDIHVWLPPDLSGEIIEWTPVKDGDKAKGPQLRGPELSPPRKVKGNDNTVT